ncbi:MAG: helix-hairpin-helix domain-containing protein [Bacteroidales bacterium]|nr:helix-hairpin-helix domain-containing protein [Bacteroidales bacterium]
MDGLRKWFTFSKVERIAVITIGVCILALVLACLLWRPRVSLDEASLHNLDSLLALRRAAVEEMEQQKASQSQEMAELQPFPFNPNTMTEEEGRRIGLTDKQIRNIINYRDKGGKFYSKNDVAKLYTISEEDFAQLESYIVLPEVARKEYAKPKTETKENQNVVEEKKVQKTIPVVDLNTADSALLTELPQIGPYTAARIVAYREKLGGYLNKEQLLEVKGMDEARYNVAAPYIKIGDADVARIDVNRADFKTLVNHPYLNYNQVKRIFNQREKRGMIKDWNQLKALLEEVEPVNPLMERYVKF